jgi:hypothetical protein
MRSGKPENSQQMNVPLHPPGTLLDCRDRADDLFAALAAKRLPGLYCCAASIAEHVSLRARPENRARSPQPTAQPMISKR